MIRRYSIVVLMTMLMVGVMAPSLLQAAGIPTIVPEACQGKDAATKCGICELAKLVRNILNAAIYLAVIAAAVLFAWTGFKFVSARDNSGALTAAKKMFWNVVLGLIIILAAWLIVNTIMSFMTNGSGNPWNKLC